VLPLGPHAGETPASPVIGSYRPPCDPPTSHGKNITQPNLLPLVVFFPKGAIGELSYLSNLAMPIVSLHQENFSELIDFVNASVVFFKVSTFSSNTFPNSIISLTK